MKLPRIVLVIALAGAALVALRAWWPTDEKRIAKLLSTLAQTASLPAQGRALGDLAAANRIADFFAPEFEINVTGPGVPDLTLSQRSELVQAVLAARRREQGVTIELLDPRMIELQSATAVVDATVRARSAGEREPFIAEVRFTLIKIDARWRVRKVENVQTFE